MDSFSSSFLATSSRLPFCNLITHHSSPPPPPLVFHRTLSISATRTGEKPAQPITPTPTNNKNKKNSKSSTHTTSSSPPRPTTMRQSVAATLCNTLDHLINKFIDPPVLRPSVDPRHVLSDNFAPVTELPPTSCPVVRGTIPSCLVGGAYIRNGPNPQHLPCGPHHLFDGDGMLHSILITSPTSATLSSRFVHTYKYLVEHHAGAPVLPNVFSFHGIGGMARGVVTAARVLTGQINPQEGVGLANTSLVFFNGQLYALGESDLPYAVNVSPQTGETSTIGRSDFNGQLFVSMTAHPKKDPITGELFAFRYGPVPPYVTYFRFDENGNKLGPDVPLFSVTQPPFLHDFAITENYAIFPDIQIVMQPMEMVMGGGSPVGSDKRKAPRVGLLPKYAKSESEMRWFDVPGFNIMHTVNAWEEEGGNVVVLVAPNVLSIEHVLERAELVHSMVEMVRIDLRSGMVWRTPMSGGSLDFGVIHPGLVGRRNRYAYLGIGDPTPKMGGVVKMVISPMPKIGGVAKLDFEMVGKGTGDCVVGKREFGAGCFAGEPFFVPASSSSSAAEDEGYLVCYVHDERKEESRFVVMDAQSPELEVVAEVVLPQRVPYGFHGLFVTQPEIQSQRLRN